MTGWQRPRRQHARLSMVLALAGLMGCGPRETLVHGLYALPDGTGVTVNSLMPHCGCMSIRSRERAGSQPIELVSWLQATEIGSFILQPEAEARFGYDWGGLDNSDTYTIEAYRLEPDGAGGYRRAANPMTPFFDFIENRGTNDADCKKMDCSFGTLRMDRVVNEGTAGGQPVTKRDGVDYTAGGTQIAASASPGTCGCMLISNSSPDKKAVTLRSSFHARQEGVMEIPWDASTERQPVFLIGFDWAGTEDQDRYLINALGVSENANVIGDPTKTLVAQDYIRIIGQMDQLECSADGAVLNLPRPTAPLGSAPPPDVVPSQATASQFQVTCPFGTLSMREQMVAGATTETAQIAKGPRPAAKGSPQ